MNLLELNVDRADDSTGAEGVSTGGRTDEGAITKEIRARVENRVELEPVGQALFFPNPQRAA